MASKNSTTPKTVKTNSSTLISHNLNVEGRRTSVRLEKEMWMAFKEIATIENCSVHELSCVISRAKKSSTSLTAAIRVFIMVYFKSSSTDDGHKSAGHGQGPLIAEATIRQHAQTPYYGLRMMKSFQDK